MKKILTAVLFCFLLFDICSATETGFVIDKQVNGDYRQRFIVNFIAEKDSDFFPKAYLNTAAIFVAPRADIAKPNHECFEVVIGAKFKLPTNAILDLSTSGDYWWAGNSQGNPEGLKVGLNTISLLWKY